MTADKAAEGEESVEPVDVLYVGGMPRSGSTLLTWLLGELPGSCAVGELFYVWTAGVRRDQLCGCGEPFSACPFWTKVGQRAFGGWDQVDTVEMENLARRVDSTRAIPKQFLARLFPAYRRDRAAYMTALARVYAAVRDVSGAHTVVDGSKRPSMAYLLARDRRIRLKVVHLVRDPRGVVNSWSKEVAIPEGAGARGHLKVRSSRVMTRRWMSVNALIAGLRRLGVPVAITRYETWMDTPAEAIRGVLEELGYDLTGVDETVQGTTLRLQRQHMVEGGRVRFAPLPIELRLDQAWQREMPRRRQHMVMAATWLSRRRYGYE